MGLIDSPYHHGTTASAPHFVSYLCDTFDGALDCVPLLRLFGVYGNFEGAFFDDGLVVGGSDIFRIVDDSGNSRFIPLSCLFGIWDLSCGQYLRNVLEG